MRKQKVEVYDAMARAARKRKAEDSSAELKEAFESLKAQGKTKDEEMKALKKIGRKSQTLIQRRSPQKLENYPVFDYYDCHAHVCRRRSPFFIICSLFWFLLLTY